MVLSDSAERRYQTTTPVWSAWHPTTLQLRMRFSTHQCRQMALVQNQSAAGRLLPTPAQGCFGSRPPPLISGFWCACMVVCLLPTTPKSLPMVPLSCVAHASTGRWDFPVACPRSPLQINAPRHRHWCSCRAAACVAAGAAPVPVSVRAALCRMRGV